MNDKYRITDVPRQAGNHTTGPERVGPDGQDRARGSSVAGDSARDGAHRDSDRVTGLLWVALAVLVALNAASSVVSPDNLLPSLAFGCAALLCVGGLVARHLGRRQS